MNSKIPAYLNDKNNIIKLIIFTSAFALIFINIYTPFGSEHWYNVSRLRFFVFSSLIILTGILVVVLSRIIMFYYCKKKELYLGQYLLWIAAEIFFMSLFYTLYSYKMDSTKDLLELFKTSARNTSLVLLLPYSISWLYLSWMEKSKKLELLEQTSIEKRNGSSMVPFRDEKGELKITVSSEHLLYLEAADNYVSINYLNKGRSANFMIRNSLKNIESSLKTHYPSIIRCHRSYMINFDKVKIMRREKSGVYLELEGENMIDIPVSKTYINQLTDRLF